MWNSFMKIQLIFVEDVCCFYSNFLVVLYKPYLWVVTHLPRQHEKFWCEML